MKRRTRGSGSLYRPTYRDPQGVTRTQAIWWLQFTAGGKRFQESTGKRRKADAEEVLRKRLAERDSGRLASDDTTLEDLFRMERADYGANGRRSAKRQERAMWHVTQHFGAETSARSITVAHVSAYIAARKKAGAMNATINRELAALRRGFRLAVIAGRLHSRPMFSLLVENNARKGFVEPHELDKLLAVLAPWAGAVIESAYITGWRVTSELLTRQRKHLDLSAGWLRLEPGETKNNEGRMFPLTNRLRAILREQLSGSWLFHRDGKRVSGKQLRAEWERVRELVGMPDKLLHDFRRTAVRNLERAGIPRSSAMKMVGHKTEGMYRRYAIVDEAMLQEAAAKLDLVSEGMTKEPRRMAGF